ncbi:MAG: GNAT family N-acetyltransferase [Oscillospiraceae bacterium]|nr:GNAT family N-acetyltransferase [Oscillospiraceae bacterium]
MENIVCRAMTVEDLHTSMLDSFVRRQEITRVYCTSKWQKGLREKTLRKPKIEDWPAEGKEKFVRNWFIHSVHLRQYYPGPPLTFGAFAGGQVMGFAYWDVRSTKEDERAILYRMFVSQGCRRQGLGRQLFALCAQAAREAGAKKLYVSAEYAVETVDFYRAMGCVDAAIDLRRELHSPKTDIALEYIL